MGLKTKRAPVVEGVTLTRMRDLTAPLAGYKEVEDRQRSLIHAGGGDIPAEVLANQDGYVPVPGSGAGSSIKQKVVAEKDKEAYLAAHQSKAEKNKADDKKAAPDKGKPAKADGPKAPHVATYTSKEIPE